MWQVAGRARAGSALIALAGAAALIGLALAPPQTYGIPPCPFYFLTGFFCPGCGALRAIHSLLHGHLSRAFGFNPLLILLSPWLALVWSGEVVAALTGKRARMNAPGWLRWMKWPGWGWAALALILAFWVVRNAPGTAFDSLRPVPENPRLQAAQRAPGRGA